MLVTTPSPSSTRNFSSRLMLRSRSCVAQAVESHLTCSVVSVKLSGVQCAEISGPTRVAHSAITEPTATGEVQPRSATKRPTTLPSPRGSRPVAWNWLNPRVSRIPRLAFWDPGRTAVLRISPRAAAASRILFRAAWGASILSGSRPGCRASSSLALLIDTSRDDLHPPSGQLFRDIGVDGGGHQDLFRTRDYCGQFTPALHVQLGKNVVEDQDGRGTTGPGVVQHHIVGREAQRQAHGPCFSVGCVPFGGRLAQDQFQFVAVWTHQRNAALQFLAAGVGKGAHIALRQLFHGELAQVLRFRCRTSGSAAGRAQLGGAVVVHLVLEGGTV